MDRSVYQVYEDEIQLLEAEIKLLSEKYEDIQQESTFFSDEEVQMSVYVLYWIACIGLLTFLYQNSFTYAFVCYSIETCTYFCSAVVIQILFRIWISCDRGLQIISS